MTTYDLNQYHKDVWEGHPSNIIKVVITLRLIVVNCRV